MVRPSKYGLSHTTCCNAARTLKLAAARLGHTKPAMTLQAHVMRGIQADAARLVANLILGPDRTAKRFDNSSQKRPRTTARFDTEDAETHPASSAPFTWKRRHQGPQEK